MLDLSAVQGLIGRNVKTKTGEDMGRIVDLLATPAGQVRAAVLDFGGVLGVGSRKVAVDWKALSFTELAKDGPVQVLLTRNQIRVAPEYKSNEPVVVLEVTPDKAEPEGKPKPVPTQAAPQPAPATSSHPPAEAGKAEPTAPKPDDDRAKR